MQTTLPDCRQKAPGYKLAVLHRLSAAFLSPPMRGLGLKRGWISALLEVLENPGLTQEALSKSLKVDRAATARTLFELEGQGYVLRREDAADRRQKLVFPTEKTLALAEAMFPILATHNRALFAGFDAARREQALALLDAMIANLEAALSKEAL
uniref:Transcriptional regulator n=1 Tax=Desulfovibrio sp. U5L TaxID=596152 RepID=I2Q3K2_9BACT